MDAAPRELELERLPARAEPVDEGAHDPRASGPRLRGASDEVAVVLAETVRDAATRAPDVGAARVRRALQEVDGGRRTKLVHMSVLRTLDDLDLTQMVMDGETTHGNLAVRMNGAAPTFMLRHAARLDSVSVDSNIVLKVHDPVDRDALLRLHDALVVLLVNTMPQATHSQVSESLARMLETKDDCVRFVAMLSDQTSRVLAVDAQGNSHLSDASVLRVGAKAHVVFRLAAMALNVKKAQMVPCVVADDVITFAA